MSKPAPRRSSAIHYIWRSINVILLSIGFFIPVVQDQVFGTISYLNILSALLMFLPGVIFQAIATPAKLPGMFLYLGGLLSLVSLIAYLISESWSLLRKGRRSLRSLILLTISGIGVFAILFLYQGHLTHGAGMIVAAMVSCLALECVGLLKLNR